MITPLSAARIAGEVGLAGGTITSSAYAVKYGGQVKSANNAANTARINATNTEWDLIGRSKQIEMYINYVNSEWTDWTKCVKEGMNALNRCNDLLNNFNTSLQKNLKGNK